MCSENWEDQFLTRLSFGVVTLLLQFLIPATVRLLNSKVFFFIKIFVSFVVYVKIMSALKVRTKVSKYTL